MADCAAPTGLCSGTRLLPLVLLCVLCPESVICMHADAERTATPGDGYGRNEEVQPDSLGAPVAMAALHAEDAGAGMPGNENDWIAAVLERDARDDIDIEAAILESHGFVFLYEYSPEDALSGEQQGDAYEREDSRAGSVHDAQRRSLQARRRFIYSCPQCQGRVCRHRRWIVSCPRRNQLFSTADGYGPQRGDDTFFDGQDTIDVYPDFPIIYDAEIDTSCRGFVPQPPLPPDYSNPAYAAGLYSDHWDETYGAIGFFGRSGRAVEIPGSEFFDSDGNEIGIRHFDEGSTDPAQSHGHLHSAHADLAYDYDMVHLYRYHHEQFDQYYLQDRGFRHRRGCRHGWEARYSTPLPPRDTSPDYHNPAYDAGRDLDHWDSTYGAVPGGNRFGWWVQTLRALVLDATGHRTGAELHYDENGGTHEHRHSDHGYDPDYDMIHMYRHHHDVFDHYYLEDRGFKHRKGPNHVYG